MNDLISAERGTGEPLTRQERIMWAACEKVIAYGIKDFVRVGAALQAIHKRRLYREVYPTFEAYCRDRWGFGRERGYRLIQAAEVEKTLLKSGVEVANERHARELAVLPAEAQSAAYLLAQQSFTHITGKPVEEMPASFVKASVVVTGDILRSGVVDDGEGGMIAAVAAVGNDVIERIQRKWVHMNDKNPAILKGDFASLEAAAEALKALEFGTGLRIIVYPIKRKEGESESTAGTEDAN
jgi:hypothetical protein